MSEIPLSLLGLGWLALLVLEFLGRLTTGLERLGRFVWILFVIDFVFRLTLSTHRTRFLVKNWLTAVSLLIPALRVFRAVRTVRLLLLLRGSRGSRLVRLFASLNRSMRALATTMGRRGFGYIVALTFLVTLGGGAGMYAFEEGDAGHGGAFQSFGHALWWTAMLMTTMGSDFWPRSPEGRVLCFVLAVYAFAVFGYVTATLATFFVERDAGSDESEFAGSRDLQALRQEIASLRADVRKLAERLNSES